MGENGELNEEELSQYLGGASEEAMAARYGISVEKYRELLQAVSADPKIMRAIANHDPNYTIEEDKLDQEHKMGGR